MTAAAWESRHPGFAANGWVRGWLALLDPLARRLTWLPPDAITALGVGLSVRATCTDRRSRAAALLVAGGICDGLDGMVAGDFRPRGRTADHLADRVGDVALVAALARAGAPRAWCTAAGVATLAMEAARGSSTVVTPGERPTRILLGCLGLLGSPRLAAAALTAVSTGSLLLLRSDRRRSSR